MVLNPRNQIPLEKEPAALDLMRDGLSVSNARPSCGTFRRILDSLMFILRH